MPTVYLKELTVFYKCLWIAIHLCERCAIARSKKLYHNTFANYNINTSIIIYDVKLQARFKTIKNIQFDHKQRRWSVARITLTSVKFTPRKPLCRVWRVRQSDNTTWQFPLKMKTTVQSNLKKSRIAVLSLREAAPSRVDLDFLCNTSFQRYMSQPPNGTSIGAAVCAQLTRVSNRQTQWHTDTQTTVRAGDISSNRPHASMHCVHAMWLNESMQFKTACSWKIPNFTSIHNYAVSRKTILLTWKDIIIIIHAQRFN